MPNIKTRQGINIHYKIYNKNEHHETILLLGGLSRDNTIWRKLVSALSENYQVIVIDNRDAGQSSNKDLEQYDIQALSQDIIELIEQLKIENFHLAGHSMGGFMAIYIAAALQDKVASLILCSTTDKQPAAGKKYLTTRITSMKASASEEASSASEADIRAAIPMLYAKENQQKALIDEIVAFETANKYPQSAMSFIRQAQACIDFDASEIVNKIISPALVVTGEEDPYYTPAVAEALAKKLPAGTKVAIIPSAAHMIQIEQPQAVGEKIVEFTQGLKLKPTTSSGSKK